MAPYPRGSEGWVITTGNCITVPHVFYFTLLEVTSTGSPCCPSCQGKGCPHLHSVTRGLCRGESCVPSVGCTAGSLLTAPACLGEVLSCSLPTTCVQRRVSQNEREVQWCNAARAGSVGGHCVQKGPDKCRVLQLRYSIPARTPFPDLPSSKAVQRAAVIWGFTFL